MVFSSLSTYLDSSNSQQQHQPITTTDGFTGNNINNNNGGGGGPGGLIRPGSMVDRARLPETALKCPKDVNQPILTSLTSTTTCSHNLVTSVRTCRRYWTRGGTLKQVLVRGGCRRKKRTSFQLRAQIARVDAFKSLMQNGSN